MMKLSRDKSKFMPLFENVYKRYQRGDLLGGDFVKFKDGFENTDWGKKQSAEKIQRIKELIETGNPFRVSAIKSSLGHTTMLGTEFTDDMYADIIHEVAPGHWGGDFFTVPQEILERIKTGINTSPGVPDKLKRSNGDHIEPEEVNVEGGDSVQQTMTTPDGGAENRQLADKNTKLQFSKNPTPVKGQKASNTVGYLKHMK